MITVVAPMTRYATKIENGRPIGLGIAAGRILRWSESFMIWADMLKTPFRGNYSVRHNATNRHTDKARSMPSARMSTWG